MEGSPAKRRAVKDRERAAYMKRHGIERTTGRCAACYRLVTIDSSKTRNAHIAVCQG